MQNRRVSWIPLHWAKCKIRETAGVGDKYNLPFYVSISFFIFSITLPALRKFTVLILKFGIKFKDFTDSGLLKIRLMSHWFVAVVLPSWVFLMLVREGVEGLKEDLR